MKAIRAGALYFTMAFGTGFVLGVFRIMWLMPRVGPRVAELMELPVMLVVSFLAARWIVRRLGVAADVRSRLGMGAVALTLLLVAEVSLVNRLRGLTFEEYLESRDPVAGTAYAVTLAAFGLMPWLIGGKQRNPVKS